MKLNSKLKAKKITSIEDAFGELVRTLRPTLTLWDYFVDWHSVSEVTNKHGNIFDKWDQLIGSKSFDKDFLNLLKSDPEIVRTIPYLVVRNGDKENKKDLMKFSITTDLGDLKKPVLEYDFNVPASAPELQTAALLFVKNTGLANMFVTKKIKSTSDFVFGIEAGLNSNARKNRSGKAMENVVSSYLTRYCKAKKLDFIEQADAKKIKLELGFTVKMDKSSRKFDFAITNGEKLVLVEVNFYNGGGSKLKSTAGEFRKLHNILSKQDIQLVWVTDGAGWNSTTRPLQDAFKEMDYVWNLSWLTNGYLDDLFQIS